VGTIAGLRVNDCRAILSQAGTRENLAENERSGLNYYSKAGHVEEYDVARAEYTNKGTKPINKSTNC
jgi:hypothetical protein